MAFPVKHLLLVFMVSAIRPVAIWGDSSFCDDDTLPCRILFEVNEIRHERGLVPLTGDDRLTALAQDWSDYLIASGKFIHRPDLLDRMRDLDLSTITENVWQASDVLPAARIVRSWMNSARHAENVISKTSTLAGIGVSRAADGRTVVVFQGASR